jgi:hypothetical protein
MVLSMYLLNTWDNDYDYQWTLIEVNHYYETSPYETEKKSTKSEAGKIQINESWIFSIWR